ncbi:MAG: hypothetical protein KDA25_06175 [Phycisphaerales bacterium]|nr:hypothetical protein [Phycisphaerales bacterium]
MPGITFDDPLFAVQAGAATDWGSISGSAMVKVPIDLQLNRGLKLELGIQALARVDARFQKFISAQLAGQVQAQARVQGQIQMPMNLFREVGFAVRLQAILEASAGIQVGIGLNIGDFIELAHSQFQLRGLPMTLFRIFMEEVDIGISLFAKVAYTAQAYANLVATATLVGDDQTDPGFNIVYGYGYGLKGGYGMRVFARAGLKDVSRFVARTVDVLVDFTIDELIAIVPAEDDLTPAILDASRAPAKIAFRIGYELGDYIVSNSVPMTGDGAQQVAMKCVEVVIEEAQRYLLRKMIDVGLDALTAFLKDQFDDTDDATWDALKQAREDLAARLMSMPSEPFDLRDSTTMNFWNDVVVLMVNLAIDVGGAANVPADTRRDLAMIWSAVQLMFVATVRLVRADASVSVIGLPPVAAAAAFEGPLTAQPHAIIGDVVRDAVEAVTGAAPVGDLTQEDLLVFLTGDAILDTLRTTAPEVDQFLEMFVDDTDAISDFARLIMTGVNSIATDDDGALDANASLQSLAYGLRLFISDKFEDIVVPVIRSAVPSHQPELLMYVDEVLLPSMHMIIDSCFDQVVNWATGEVSQQALEEALSSVIMAVIGRTVVLTADLMIAYSQEQTVDILEALAREPGAPEPANAIIHVPSGFPEAAAGIIAPAVPLSESDVADGLREFLGIAAAVAAPFPPATRKKIRGLMYDLIAPLPAENPGSLLESLKNDLWIPNDGALKELGGELMGQVGERLVEFALRLCERLGEIMIEQLLEAFAAAAAAIGQWVEGLAAAIQMFVARLAEIALELTALLGAIEDLAGDALDAIQSLLGAMSGRRTALKTSIVDHIVADATVILDEHPLFMPLPPAAKTSARNAMRAAVAATVGAPILDPVFDAVSAIATEANDFLDDVRDLDPNEGLVTGIATLLTTRIEDALLASFGGSDPGIDVEFNFSWSCPEVIYHPPTWEYPTGWFETKEKTCSQSFDLGRVELPVSGLFSLIADLIMSASTVEQWIVTLAQTVHDLLVAELETIALGEEQDTLAQEKAQTEAEQALAGVAVGAVSIIEPAMTSVHHYSVPIAVVIEGVLPEFVRAGDDVPDRVFVYLDGEPLDVDDFEITAWPGSAPASFGPGLVSATLINGFLAEETPDHHTPDAPAKKKMPAASDIGRDAVEAAIVRHTSRRARTTTGRSSWTRGTVVAHQRTGTERESLTKAGTPNDRRDLMRRGPAASGTKGAGKGTPVVPVAPSTQDELGPGTLLAHSIPLSTLDEGFHTLVVSVFDGAGREQRDVTTFVVEAAAQSTKDGRHPEGTIPRRTALKREDIEPKKASGRPMFPTKKERDARSKRAKDAVLRRAVDPVARAASVSAGTRAIAARRFPERSFAPVPEVEIEITATAPPARPPREVTKRAASARPPAEPHDRRQRERIGKGNPS